MPGGHRQSDFQRPTLPGARLTALDGVRRGLQGDDPSAGLWDVHPEDQPDARVLPADVRLALAQLDVGVPQLQDARAVDAAGRVKTPFKTEDPLSKQGGLPTGPPSSAKLSNWTAKDGKKLRYTDKYSSQGFTLRGAGNTRNRSLEKPQWKSLLWGGYFHANFSTLRVSEKLKYATAENYFSTSQEIRAVYQHEHLEFDNCTVLP